MTELEMESTVAVAFDKEVRKVTMGELESSLGTVGLIPVRRYGARIANDLLTDDGLKGEKALFDSLLQLELALCDQEPYVRVGAMYQLIAVQP